MGKPRENCGGRAQYAHPLDFLFALGVREHGREHGDVVFFSQTPACFEQVFFRAAGIGIVKRVEHKQAHSKSPFPFSPETVFYLTKKVMGKPWFKLVAFPIPRARRRQNRRSRASLPQKPRTSRRARKKLFPDSSCVLRPSAAWRWRAPKSRSARTAFARPSRLRQPKAARRPKAFAR